MRNIFLQYSIILLCLLAGKTILAQDTLSVEEGLGTLEEAIQTYGGDRVYKLSAGAWYGLNSIIDVSEETLGEVNSLHIIGEDTEDRPPVIQVGMDETGSAFPVLFRVESDLTIKNVFLVAQDVNGIMGSGVFSIDNSVKLVIDNCVIDPAGVNSYAFGSEGLAGGSVFYLTNSLIMNNGNMEGPNDGGLMNDMHWDTLWVENNTFVSSGYDFIATPTHNMPNNKFIWINHNTFFWHDVYINRSYNDQNFFFTNNLLHDISIFAHLYEWGQFTPDYKQGNTMLSLICIDTLETVIDGLGNKEYESLPSSRQFFWEYNLQNNSPQLYSLPLHALDSGYDPLYLMPMLWDDKVPIEYTGGVEVVSPADSSRENRILADDANWPYMKYDNNWYDTDPLYNDPRIYSTNDSMIKNVTGWYSFVIWREGGLFDGTPSYYFEVDRWAGTPPDEYPLVWPRFDGSYTNTDLLSASIEGLPLGDLNWFPDAKVRWMAEKGDIEAHILALNEDRYELGPGVGIEDVSHSASFSIYPNPANEVLYMDSDAELNSVQVFDMAGKMLQEIHMGGAQKGTLDVSGLHKGMYILEIETLSGETRAMKVLKN